MFSTNVINSATRQANKTRLVLHLCYIVIILMVIQGCATKQTISKQLRKDQPNSTQKQLAQCNQWLHQVQSDIKTHNAVDAQTAVIEGFPFLRVNRFLSTLANKHLTEASFRQWLDMAAKLGQISWQVQLKNAGVDNRKNHQIFNHCQQTVNAIILENNQLKQALLAQANVPSDYNTWQRVLGLYYLSSIPFANGIEDWRRETLQAFNTPVTSLKNQGTLISYTPKNKVELSDQQIESIMTNSTDNPLDIPMPETTDIKQLFDHFAPVWHIDSQADYDKIGLIQQPAPTIKLNFNHPTVYTKTSYTFFQGKILLQLNYNIWFSKRPSSGMFNLYGGHLDGIIWRVTLDRQGQPIFYDTIHDCGCYHMVFPVGDMELVNKDLSYWHENLFVPKRLDFTDHQKRIHLYISSGKHYLQNVQYQHQSHHTQQIKTYQMQPYDQLRSLPSENGYASLFDQNGMIENTQRNERFYFWPMGVPSAGQMRQWGHYAIAFIGERYFDDPFLFEHHFEHKKSTSE